MALTEELRAVLLHGPPGPNGRWNPLHFGGAATIYVQYRRHRQELLDACPPGRRPWAFWRLEHKVRPYPGGERLELKAIRAMQCYRDEAERDYVTRRLGELLKLERQRRKARIERPALRAVA